MCQRYFKCFSPGGVYVAMVGSRERPDTRPGPHAVCLSVVSRIFPQHQGRGWPMNNTLSPAGLGGGLNCEDSDSIYPVHAQEEGGDYTPRTCFLFF